MSLPKTVWRWAFYDFANSSYVLIFNSFLLPIFFSTVLIQHGYSLSSWGWANGISTVIGVALSIVIGRIADKGSRWVVFLWSIIATGVGMIVLTFAISAAIPAVFWLFIATNSLFILSISVSDSILPHLSDKNSAYHFGGFAWGFGYVGGIVSLLIVLVLQKYTNDYSPIVFLSVAIFYLLFSWYSLRGLRNLPMNVSHTEAPKRMLDRSSRLWLFLGYWLISECITVIILFFSIFGNQELGLSTAMMGALLLLLQVIAFPATWAGGYLVKRFDPVVLLGGSIACWGLTIAFLLIHASLWTLLAAVLFGGLAIGNSQSLLRSQFATLIDRSESGVQFGIYAIVSEAAVFIGPIVYGYASDRLHSQRIPLLILFGCMVIGYGLIVKIMRRVAPSSV